MSRLFSTSEYGDRSAESGVHVTMLVHETLACRIGRMHSCVISCRKERQYNPFFVFVFSLIGI